MAELRSSINDLGAPPEDGWKILGKRNRPAYINKSLGLICKQPFLLAATYRRDIMVPTIKLSDGWVIQPICSFKNRRSALNTIMKKTGGNKRFTYDIHLYNVGRWRGKPYLFDW